MLMLPADFDAARYLSLNPDLQAAYGADTVQASNHWLNWGKAEGRNYGQTGWMGNTDPRTFWAGSDKSSIEIDRLISQGYAHPETYAQYGPGSASWVQDRGVLPTDPGWADYIARTQASGRAEAARQAAADDDDFGILEIAALAAATYFGGAALGAWSGAGEAAAASSLASAGEAAAASSLASADAMAGIGASAWAAPTAATVSPATWAAFGNTASTADLYAAATQSAINTSVADYAAAAVAGESVGAASAFSAGLPLSSLSAPAASASFSGLLSDAVNVASTASKAAANQSTSALGTAAEVVGTAAKVVGTVAGVANGMRLLDSVGNRASTPIASTLPTRGSVGDGWSPPAVAMPGAVPIYQENAINRAPGFVDPSIMQQDVSLTPYLLAAAGLFFVVAYFGKSK